MVSAIAPPVGLTARTGATRDGLPVSVNAAPDPDNAPYIGRLFVTIIDQPPAGVTEDFLLNETGMVRVLVRGSWAAAAVPRIWEDYDGPLLFGPQRRPMPVRCEGPMAVAGFTIRPSGWFGIERDAASGIADRLVRLTGEWGRSLAWACQAIDDREETFARLNQVVRHRIDALGRPAPHPVADRFEHVARLEPTRAVSAIAEEMGLPHYSFERLITRYFGHPPKTVLRRSRFLDIAAVMRGLAIPDADGLAEMRFYDQSHLNREFRLFTGMTPGAFRRSATPLLTPGLEVRQQRKLMEMPSTQPKAPWLP